ncbi:MAG TPA: hypothetical protein VF815_34160 [Myxococcaceae bacterium]
MTSERDFILERVSAIAAGRPVRWSDERTSLGDFDGRDWAIDIFDVPSEEQREVHARLWRLNRLVWKQFHQSLIFIFHTPVETERLYAWVRIAEPQRMVDSAHPARPRVEIEKLAGRRGSWRDRGLLPSKPSRVA